MYIFFIILYFVFYFLLIIYGYLNLFIGILKNLIINLKNNKFIYYLKELLKLFYIIYFKKKNN